jgi:hypothetical protein
MLRAAYSAPSTVVAELKRSAKQTMKKALAVIIFLSLANAYAGLDPFAGSVADWRTEIVDQKPFLIEFAYAELPHDLPPSPDGNRIVTEEFLKSARKVVVSAASVDSGRIEREDGTVIVYRLKDEKGVMKLAFSVATRLSGVHELTSEISFPVNKWLAWGGLTSQKLKKVNQAEVLETLYYTLAIRIKNH